MSDNSSGMHGANYDEEELKLIKEENDLLEEMGTFGEKFQSCNIVHDRIVNNLRKILSKYDSKYSITEDISRNNNMPSEHNTGHTGQHTQENHETTLIKNTQNMNNMSDNIQETNSENNENKEVVSNSVFDQMIQDYSNLLSEYKEKIKTFLENSNKEKFEELVKDKFKIVSKDKKNKPDLYDKKNENLHENLRKKPIGKLEEYYSDDEEEREVNQRIREECKELSKEYFIEVRFNNF
jgi:hypothetical protein